MYQATPAEPSQTTALDVHLLQLYKAIVYVLLHIEWKMLKAFTVYNPGPRKLMVQVTFNDKLLALKEEEYCFIVFPMQEPIVPLPLPETQKSLTTML